MLIDSAKAVRPGQPAGFEHSAFVYIDDLDFVRRAVPFLRAGLTAGEVVAVAAPRPHIALLQEHLGDCADQVAFIDMAEAGRNPARIIPLWRELLDRHPGRPMRGIGEPAYPGRSPAELEETRLHEALLNVAFEHTGPFRLRCPYDIQVLSPALSVAESHAVVFPADPRQGLSSPAPNREQSWAEQAEKAFRTPLPAVPEGAVRRTFGLADLSGLRGWAAGWARAQGLAGDRIEDLTLALHEICTNSVRFGGGRGTLSVWREDRTLIWDVTDAGHLTDLLVGRVPAPVTDEGGRGVWLANQLCDLVQLRSPAHTTQVRLHLTLPADSSELHAPGETCRPA
ncbi:MAG TPA: sensor histidine kinase [Kribbella sp.]|nr:sensor histidine kinase [Kribbella sp.]